MITILQFQKTILDWHRRNGRHDLPWRRKRDVRDPYRILVSEMMLQQTQVDRVIPKYESFLKRFPDAKALAKAPIAEVLREWKGLGYNRRALFLKRAAEEITDRRGGRFPRDEEDLRTLPGVGEYTARAVSVFGFNVPKVFIETNIRRVFIHFFFHDAIRVNDEDIILFVQKALWKKDPRLWYGALMDYGATAMSGVPNPNRKSNHYTRQSRFEGSTRQARAEILRYVLEQKKGARVSDVRKFVQSRPLLLQYSGISKLEKILVGLARDGFLQMIGGFWHVKT